MSEKAIFMRGVAGLVPDDDAAREALQGVPIGALVACEVSRPRNLKHLRLYWKLCATIGDAVGKHREIISDMVKVRSGHCTVVKSAKGETFYFPKSVSFPKMTTDGEFRAYFNNACQIICEEFIPHMKPSQLRDEILRMAGVPVETPEAA